MVGWFPLFLWVAETPALINHSSLKTQAASGCKNRAREGISRSESRRWFGDNSTKRKIRLTKGAALRGWIWWYFFMFLNPVSRANTLLLVFLCWKHTHTNHQDGAGALNIESSQTFYLLLLLNSFIAAIWNMAPVLFSYRKQTIRFYAYWLHSYTVLIHFSSLSLLGWIIETVVDFRSTTCPRELMQTDSFPKWQINLFTSVNMNNKMSQMLCTLYSFSVSIVVIQTQFRTLLRASSIQGRVVNEL